MNRKYTPSDLYRKYEIRLFRAWCDRRDRRLAAAFPDTGGHPQYVHNWHRCSKDPERAARADQLLSWEPWYRISHRYRRLYAHALHHEHGPHFRPLWCQHCQQEQDR